MFLFSMMNNRLILQTMIDEKDLRSAKEEAELLARTDMLTQMNNRRAFFDLGEVAFQSSKRYGGGLAVIAIDIDYFKSINDTYGHGFGDIAIKEVANTILHVLRKPDITGRLGGEEFSVILPETSMEGAMPLAERIRTSISEISIPVETEKISFTASIGVAGFNDQISSLNDIIINSDRALYEAKEAGRNRVIRYKGTLRELGAKDK